MSLIPPQLPTANNGEHLTQSRSGSAGGFALSGASDISDRRAAWRTAIAATLAFAAGLATVHTATDGFEAYTLESARRLHVLRAPAPLPTLTLDRADGGRIVLSEVPGRVLLVDFIYTRCQTYCAALGSVYAQLQRRLAPEIAAGDVRLVSVSFDPAHDGPAKLRAYRTRNGAGSAGWEIGGPAHPDELQGWLSAFGVVVIPDGLGGYTHNAAIHLVDPERKLAAIFDLRDIDAIVQSTRETLGKAAPNDAVR